MVRPPLRQLVEDIDPDAVRPRSRVVPRPAGAPLVETERHHQIVDAGGGCGTVAQQLVGSGRRSRIDRARHREQLDSAVTGLLGGDQAAAALAALDHDEHLDERGQDAVAQREAEGVGRRARWPLGDDRTAGADFGPQRRVLLGVRRVGTVADHGQRAGIGMREGAAVGGAVDALRQTRHDGDATRGQLEAELGGRLPSALRGVAGADDPDAAGIEHRQIASDEQHRRRPRVVKQGRRIALVTVSDHRRAGVDAALPALGRVTEPAGAAPRLRDRVVLRPQRGDAGRWRRLADGHLECGRRVVVSEQRRQPRRGHAVETGERGEVPLGWRT